MHQLREYFGSNPSAEIVSSFDDNKFELRRNPLTTFGWFSRHTTYLSGRVDSHGGGATLRWRPQARRAFVAFLLAYLAGAAAVLAAVLALLSTYGWIWLGASVLIGAVAVALGWRALRRVLRADPYLVSHLQGAMASICRPETLIERHAPASR
ncbi:MAG: hypothetical protein ABSE52_07185 [Candidatus Dormibacteria bacterium]